jgi:hypothetical protein
LYERPTWTWAIREKETENGRADEVPTNLKAYNPERAPPSWRKLFGTSTFTRLLTIQGDTSSSSKPGFKKSWVGRGVGVGEADDGDGVGVGDAGSGVELNISDELLDMALLETWDETLDDKDDTDSALDDALLALGEASGADEDCALDETLLAISDEMLAETDRVGEGEDEGEEDGCALDEALLTTSDKMLSEAESDGVGEEDDCAALDEALLDTAPEADDTDGRANDGRVNDGRDSDGRDSDGRDNDGRTNEDETDTTGLEATEESIALLVEDAPTGVLDRLDEDTPLQRP